MIAIHQMMERFQLLPSHRQEDCQRMGARQTIEIACRLFIIPRMMPDIGGGLRPGRANQMQTVYSACRGGFCGIGRDLRRIRVGRIDERRHVFRPQISRQSLNAAEAARPARTIRQSRLEGAPGQ